LLSSPRTNGAASAKVPTTTDGDSEPLETTRQPLRPLGRRELGRALHRHNYRDARERIVALLAAVEPPQPEGEPTSNAPGDPGGSPRH